MAFYEMSNQPTTESRQIRLEVFVNEQGFENEFDQYDEVGNAFHFVMFDDNGLPVATCRMNKEAEGVYHIGRVAVKKDCRKKGYGAKVIAVAEGAATDIGGKLITIGSQVQALGFYLSLGYIKEGEEYIEEGKPHVKVYKIL